MMNDFDVEKLLALAKGLRDAGCLAFELGEFKVTFGESLPDIDPISDTGFPFLPYGEDNPDEDYQ